MAAEVLVHIGVSAFGVGGPELRRARFESVVPMERLSAMGFGAARKLMALSRAWLEVSRAADRHQPSVALLVGFSEFNARLGRWLRRRGTRVVWYAPPQIWAWRAGRGPDLARCADHHAVILPFEEDLWRGLGAHAAYVGHPALHWHSEEPRTSGRIALLPGSRPHEVERLWPILLQVISRLRNTEPSTSFEVSISPALPERLRADVARTARRAGARASHDATSVLARAELAFCCSGTATLQSALAGCPPLVLYPTSRLTELALRRVVRVPHIGLPNLVLDRRAFPELVGQGVQPSAIADTARRMAAHLEAQRQACSAVRQRLSVNVTRPAAQTVARLVEQYL